MDKLIELDKLIAEVLGGEHRGLMFESGVEMTADKAIPAVPYPKLTLTDGWGQSASSGFDVALFKLAGLAGLGTLAQRLEKLNTLVDCNPQQCGGIKEIIARLAVMEMFSSMMHDYVDASKGFLFENFLALALKGTVVGGTTIQDIEILRGDKPTSGTTSVSLKLLKPKSVIEGSLGNLYKHVMGGKNITYVVGYKAKAGVQIREIVINKEFMQERVLGKSKDGKPITLYSLYHTRINAGEESGQFRINWGLIRQYKPVATVKVYPQPELRKKAEQLTAKMNQPITEIYTNLNLFSQQLTKYYIENDMGAASKAKAAFTNLQAAVIKDAKLKE